MKPKSIVKFSDSDYLISDIDDRSRSILPRSWIRVEFKVPDDYVASETVLKWVKENHSDEWGYYSYKDGEERQVVIKFKDMNDALMFKLRGGHQCWKTS